MCKTELVLRSISEMIDFACSKLVYIDPTTAIFDLKNWNSYCPLRLLHLAICR